jgi:catechol 2,3-dioxygenase-like lactoylglutathione lyase family enzyme
VTQGLTLDRIALNVGDLGAATQFYCAALGFTVARAAESDAELAGLLGVRAVRSVRLQRGRQLLELSACDPAGAPIPQDSRSNDSCFQHCALATDNLTRDYETLCRFAFTLITRGGPRTLPGGITAFKFRDPEGHPLELIEFPVPNPATGGGIDHSAICVAAADASAAFYASRLGLAVEARQCNAGAAQDALDNLDDVAVDVVALAPGAPGPHVELLHYRQPRGRNIDFRPNDMLASRLVFATMRQQGAGLALLRDPDGHAVLLDPRS